MKPAIVVIDMAKDFVYGKLKCEKALKIIPSLKKLIEEAMKRYVRRYCKG